jgi:hypothetical protein
MKKEIEVRLSMKLLCKLIRLSSYIPFMESKTDKKIREIINIDLALAKTNNQNKDKNIPLKINIEEFRSWYILTLFENNESMYLSKEANLDYDKEIYSEQTLLFAKLMDYFSPIIANNKFVSEYQTNITKH